MFGTNSDEESKSMETHHEDLPLFLRHFGAMILNGQRLEQGGSLEQRTGVFANSSVVTIALYKLSNLRSIDL